jgi:16S rRNA A1518/A1519 N6-dimethyltransferase RsmA/KsgA/DIM1 with predicted DNA glycosylase/AP lyase activity
MLLFALILFIVGLTATLAFLGQGPPFVPTDDDSAANMVKLIKTYRPKRLLDMGSGDGRLVLYLAQQGYQVDGIELNPWLVWRSRRAIKRAGLQARATIYWGSFWRYDVSGYDVVLLYVIKHIMPRLEQKLQAELPVTAHIVSNYFEFPNLQPVRRLGRIQLYAIV